MLYDGEWDYPAQPEGSKCPRCGLDGLGHRDLNRIGQADDHSNVLVKGKMCMGCLATWPLLYSIL